MGNNSQNESGTQYSTVSKPDENNSDLNMGTKSSSEVRTKSSQEMTTKSSSELNSNSQNLPTNSFNDFNQNDSKQNDSNKNDKIQPPVDTGNNKNINEKSSNAVTKNPSENLNNENSFNEKINSDKNNFTTKAPNDSNENLNPTKNPSGSYNPLTKPGHSDSKTENPKKGESIVHKSTAPIKTVTPGTTSKPSNSAFKGATKISSSTITATTETLSELISTIATSTEQTFQCKLEIYLMNSLL